MRAGRRGRKALEKALEPELKIRKWGLELKIKKRRSQVLTRSVPARKVEKYMMNLISTRKYLITLDN